jgi:hypothetical protein
MQEFGRDKNLFYSSEVPCKYVPLLHGNLNYFAHLKAAMNAHVYQFKPRDALLISNISTYIPIPCFVSQSPPNLTVLHNFSHEPT